jgi:hypothetical protein
VSQIKYVLELTQAEFDWMVAFHGNTATGNNPTAFGIYSALYACDKDRVNDVYKKISNVPSLNASQLSDAMEMTK